MIILIKIKIKKAKKILGLFLCPVLKPSEMRHGSGLLSKAVSSQDAGGGADIKR